MDRHVREREKRADRRRCHNERRPLVVAVLPDSSNVGTASANSLSQARATCGDIGQGRESIN